MNIDCKQIKEKYPLAFNKFLTWDSFFYYSKSYHQIFRNVYPANSISICYCDLEKFFDENGIIIFIIDTGNELPFSFKIFDKQSNKWLYSDLNYWERDKTKETAIYIAFEILNNQ